MLWPRAKSATREITPVFFDVGGRRWRRVIICAIVALALVVAVVVPLTVFAERPVWTVAEHSESGYPAQLLASNHGGVPVIGAETSNSDTTDDLARVDLVQHRGGVTCLVDPFSGRIIRKALPPEVAVIGSHHIAEEYYGRLASHQLALTFDDGPSPVFTPQILNILGKAHVPATFFVIGKYAAQYPALVRREVREGYVVGNHTLMHEDAGHGSLLDRENMIGDDRIIRAVAGYQTRFLRIPNADPDSNLQTELQAQQLGYVVVNLDLDSHDWESRKGQTIPLPKLDEAGHIILMHDGGADRAATVNFLTRLIAEARAKSYTFTTPQALVPAQYEPKKHVTASVADRFTLYTAQALLVLPGLLIGWLFWFGAGSVVVMSLAYLVLALINLRRQRRRVWPVIPNPPMVSIVVPAYNEESVLAKTLRSLLKTDYPNFEVIAVDDGSTDNTWGVLSNYADVWPRLRIFRQERNMGKAAAMNRALHESRGEIIVTIDGDTVFEPQSIAAMARHFTDPRVAAVAGQVKVGNRRNILTAWQSLEYISGLGLNRMAEDLMNAISIVPGACGAWRKSAMEEAGGISIEVLADDADMTLHLQQLGYRIELENDAVSWTEAPMTVRALAKQRVRWAFALLQAYRKYRRMVLRPDAGALGMAVLPYALISLIIPLLFMPLAYLFLGLVLASGHWQPVAIFAGVIAVIQFVTAAVAIAMVHERWWHLFLVPAYRLIYEPLRAYVLYKSVFLAMKGKAVGWAHIVRTGTV
jgi:cellulose synthase/poly-beta-1,6-N-acetylglucosamine synthase-like glycosyltransferase/peptidoglycan/xylan/chitin deacetylase (PgdA/CDA1 family)